MRLKVGALIVKGGDLYVIIIEFCFILFHRAGLTFSSFFPPLALSPCHSINQILDQGASSRSASRA